MSVESDAVQGNNSDPARGTVSVLSIFGQVTLTALSFLAAFAFRDIFTHAWDHVTPEGEDFGVKIVLKIVFFVVSFGSLLFASWFFSPTKTTKKINK